MPEQTRDGRGQFTAKMSEQDILIVFDFDTTAKDPYLTAGEVADGLAGHFEIDVTDEAVRQRLRTMARNGLVRRRKFGGAVAWGAEVAPRLAEDVAAQLDATAEDEYVALDSGETTSLDELVGETGGE